jgi:regulator of protease activity HflC (stomatin/prohibitin superfamily)
MSGMSQIHFSWLPAAATMLAARFAIQRAGSVACGSAPVFQAARHASTVAKQFAPKVNTVVNVVPSGWFAVVERFGKFSGIAEPGLNVLVPLVHRFKWLIPKGELAIPIDPQSGITKDNVTASMDGVLYLRVVDPVKASYAVVDVVYAASQLAQTTMRSLIGELSLASMFAARKELNERLVAVVNKAGEDWGIVCTRYEIKAMDLPHKVVEVMQKVVEADRERQAAITRSEGARQAAINESEGLKIAEINRADAARQATVFASEAECQRQKNLAEGQATAVKMMAEADAFAVVTQAEAQAMAIEFVARAMAKPHADDTAALNVANKYVEAFAQVAQKGTTVLLPANMSDPAAFVSQALAVYRNVATANK